VFARDRGVCSECKLDTVRLEGLIRRWQHRVRLPPQARPQGLRAYRGKRRILALLKLDPETGLSRTSYWDMDHELPVVEGGGECGLDNLRTLCLWCHANATRRLARRRARARAPQDHLFDDAILDADLDGKRSRRRAELRPARQPQPTPAQRGLFDE